MKRYCFLFFLVCILFSSQKAVAQDVQSLENVRTTTSTTSFWHNWYVQAGVDMMLQNPHGYDFKDVFPNGNSLGIEAAVGRWFTPGVGVRFKLDWNNWMGGFLKNGHHCWLGPWGEPGANNDGGGVLAGYGDVQFNLFHYIHGRNAQRKWTLLAYPRMGFITNRAINTGSLILGVGVQNLYRVSERWSVYADLSYQMMTSGIGMDPSVGTGLGASSNGFFDISLGAQFDLDPQRPEQRYEAAGKGDFWKEWYIQAGLDLDLQNPYGKDFFGNVFPKGTSFGIHAAAKKQVCPELALRAKVLWTNGIVKNSGAEWLAPFGKNGRNYASGGMLALYAEPHLCLSDVIRRNEERPWNIAAYPRMGLIYNFAMKDVSPVIGAGVINYYRLTPKLSLYFDVAYNMSTTEYTSSWETWSGGGKNGNANGFFDLNLGVQFKLKN